MEPEDDALFAEMRDEEQEFWDMEEDGVVNACYIEYSLEEWPLLTRLDAAAKERLYDAFAESLRAAQSPPEVIGARGETLFLVVHQSSDLSIADVEGILDSVCEAVAKQHPDDEGPQALDAVSLSRRDIAAAVMRSGGKLYGVSGSDTTK